MEKTEGHYKKILKHMKKPVKNAQDDMRASHKDNFNHAWKITRSFIPRKTH